VCRADADRQHRSGRRQRGFARRHGLSKRRRRLSACAPATASTRPATPAPPTRLAPA
jgi:hypothetical protein